MYKNNKKGKAYKTHILIYIVSICMCVNTCITIPSFGREGWCIERRPMEMDDMKMHSLDHFSLVGEKKHTSEFIRQICCEIRL